MRTARSAIGRTAAGLGIGAAASCVLAIADGPPWRLVTLGGTGTLVMLVLAAVAVTAGLVESRALIALAGAGFLAAAVVQLVQIAWTGANHLLGGDGSTVALLLGFAVGLLALGLTPAPDDRDTPTSATGRHDPA
ncbi:Rv1678 family membrane protein [Streptomyces sp. IBSNAI002]|uniref:Rv1678 family membrane protein n=1 Tax=Streptomyces sp. IBSNAI002 TaxID=3457500 RepID=UPI003FD37608